jgi:four helix bundle protein
MAFKFERLQVWELSLEYLDLLYEIGSRLPAEERFNVRDQLIRSGTSTSLNVAEGSTGQTNPEQNRFLGISLKSLIESIACRRIIERRGWIKDQQLLSAAEDKGVLLARMLQSMRRTLNSPKGTNLHCGCRIDTGQDAISSSNVHRLSSPLYRKEAQ